MGWASSVQQHILPTLHILNSESRSLGFEVVILVICHRNSDELCFGVLGKLQSNVSRTRMRNNRQANVG